MSWRKRFRRRVNRLEGLWLVPVIGAVLGGVLGFAVSVTEEHLGSPSPWHFSPSTATAVLTSIVGATAALTGFVVTVTVLLVQMATGTFSARILRLWYRDPLLKGTLAVLVFTFTFSFSVLRRIDDDFVPDLGVTMAGLAVSLSLLFFIVFFDRSIRRLRPVAVAADVARAASSAFAQTVRLADRSDIRWTYGSRSRRSDPRRGRQPRRRHPSRRSRRARRLGSGPWCRARPAVPGGRLRADRRRAGACVRR